ncbi:hypothetical protein Q0Z83_050220 [Actinoplanes sichuanensis]|nr:hypothetical protein Q0Z83_050220 [Actinoplanes sichuanensis]
MSFLLTRFPLLFRNGAVIAGDHDSMRGEILPPSDSASEPSRSPDWVVVTSETHRDISKTAGQTAGTTFTAESEHHLSRALGCLWRKVCTFALPRIRGLGAEE